MYFEKCKIVWNPENLTNKHLLQASWKYVAYVEIDCEIYLLYKWFIEKRFGIKMVEPLRGFHLTFINDRVENPEEFHKKCLNLNITHLDIELCRDIRFNGEHFWFKAKSENALNVREMLGIGEPFFGFHATIGKPIIREGQDFAIKSIEKYLINE